ncbi:MAG: outer membrane beta-barrel protein [Bacteroidales bacterium]|nr:outer membrane beta-barrel protein [Bacteroidales bacterium]
MKKIFLLMGAMVLALGASAQKESKYIGGNLNFAGRVNSAGLGVKGLYQFEKEWRGEVGMNVFPSSGTSLWGVYGNVHYLVPVADKVNIYPLGGLEVMFWSYDAPKVTSTNPLPFVTESKTEMRVGLNLGVGGEYQLNRNWLLQAELKGQIVSGYSQGMLSLGVAYRFD